MSFDYTPNLKGYSHQEQLRFYCQKVLPLVYDDSLSYYEVLEKLKNKLNEVIEYFNEGVENIIREELDTYYADAVYNASDKSLSFNFGTPSEEETVLGFVDKIKLNSGTTKIDNRHFHATNHIIAYVDGINGNDDNDGSTLETAFKTIDAAFNKMASQAAGYYIRVYGENCTFDIGYPVISACMLHIFTYSRGIKYRWSTNHPDWSKALYNCYTHFEGYFTEENPDIVDTEFEILSEINAAGEYKRGYPEVGGLNIRNMKITTNDNIKLALNMVSGNFSYCDFYTRVRISRSNITFSNCKFYSNEDNISDVNIIQGVYGSSIFFDGTTKFYVPDTWTVTQYFVQAVSAKIFFNGTLIIYRSDFVVNTAENPEYVVNGTFNSLFYCSDCYFDGTNGNLRNFLERVRCNLIRSYIHGVFIVDSLHYVNSIAGKNTRGYYINEETDNVALPVCYNPNRGKFYYNRDGSWIEIIL